MRYRSKSYCLWIFSCPSTSCWKDYSLPIEWSLHPCSESVDSRYECISGPSVFFLLVCLSLGQYCSLFFFKWFYLFMTVLSVCCSLDFSLAVSGGSYSPVVVHRLLTAVASFLAEHMGLVVTLNGPSCLASCGIFPDQRSNPCALHCQVNSLPLSHQGSPGRQSWFTVVL